VEVVEIEGSITVFLSECFGDIDIFEFIVEEDPLIAKSDHIFDAILTLLLERCEGGGLRGEVRCRCMFRTGCLHFLRWG